MQSLHIPQENLCGYIDLRLTLCVCRVPTSLKPIFGDAWTKEQLFSEAEVAKHLRQYAKDQGLAEGKSEIKLDELLVGNLYNKKEPQQAGNLDDFDEVVRRLQGKLQQFHRVLRQSPQVGRIACLTYASGNIDCYTYASKYFSIENPESDCQKQARPPLLPYNARPQ